MAVVHEDKMRVAGVDCHAFRGTRTAFVAGILAGLLEQPAKSRQLLALVDDTPREDANDWDRDLGAMHCVAHETHAAQRKSDDINEAARALCGLHLWHPDVHSGRRHI